MKNRFKIMSGALALTFMLIFGAVAFAHTNTSMANANMSSEGQQLARKERWERRRHRRHHRRDMRGLNNRENRELRHK